MMPRFSLGVRLFFWMSWVGCVLQTSPFVLLTNEFLCVLRQSSRLPLVKKLPGEIFALFVLWCLQSWKGALADGVSTSAVHSDHNFVSHDFFITNLILIRLHRFCRVCQTQWVGLPADDKPSAPFWGQDEAHSPEPESVMSQWHLH